MLDFFITKYLNYKNSKNNKPNTYSSGENKIIINGVEFNVSGKNINVDNNNNILIDGKKVTGPLFGNIKIEFFGDIATLDCTSAVIHGNVLGDVDATSINCGDVGGNVDGSTINCKNVKGYIDGTTIKCGSCSGSIRL